MPDKSLTLAVDMYGCPNRCKFQFFVHSGSCDGENRRLYDLRIEKEARITDGIRRRKSVFKIKEV